MAIQASGGNETPMGLGDSVYQRLLKERIIWLGGEVREIGRASCRARV